MKSVDKKIVLFSSVEFLSYAESALPNFEFEHFSSFDTFFEAKAKLYAKPPFSLNADDNIKDYYNITCEEPEAFWVVECPKAGYVTSIVKPVAFLRWMQFKTPILVSSFLNLPDMVADPLYDMKGLFKDHPHEEQFLRLPFRHEEFEAKYKSLTPLKSVIPLYRKHLLDHDLKYLPYSRKTKDMTLDNPIIEHERKCIPLHILVVDNQEYYLNEIENNLKNAIGKTPLDDIKIEIERAKTPAEVREHYMKNPNIQAVFLDWSLNNTLEEKNPTPDLLEWMKKFRPKIPIYIITNTRYGIDIANQTKAVYDAYFTKDELNKKPTDILGRVLNDFNYRRKTPFWSAFKQYVDGFSDSWHTPGHSRGASFKNSKYLRNFYDYWGDRTFAADLSVSVGHLGSLLDSTKFVREAQKKAAETFGTKHTFFATNGSSTSNKIMLQSIIKPGQKVIVDKNCHKSVHYACIQAGANVVYLTSEYNKDLGIFAPPSLAVIENALKKHKDAKVIVITGCTYDGLLIDVKQVVAKVKEYGNKIKVFIDEAWFAYSGFHPSYFDYSAIRSGADYITHSTHKVLSAFSQASYLHINDPDFDEDFFREIFYIYTSTSPQYQMIASLDVASMQMEMEGFVLVEDARQKAIKFVDDIKANLTKIKVLSKEDIMASFPSIQKDNIEHDCLKVTIDIRDLKKSTEEIEEFLRNTGRLEIEKSTHATITILFTIGIEQDKINRLYSALCKLDAQDTGNYKREEYPELPKNIELKCLPYKAFYTQHAEECNISDLRDKIKKETYLSTRLVTPYPPGIPCLVPGQKIKIEHLKYLENLINQNVDIHGCKRSKIYVVKDSEIKQTNNKIKK